MPNPKIISLKTIRMRKGSATPLHKIVFYVPAPATQKSDKNPISNRKKKKTQNPPRPPRTTRYKINSKCVKR